MMLGATVFRVMRVPPPGVVAYAGEGFGTVIVPAGMPLDAGVVTTLACDKLG